MSGILGSLENSFINRLTGTGLAPGGGNSFATQAIFNAVGIPVNSGSQFDNRVYITDPSGTTYNDPNAVLLTPLQLTGGVLFPYTPTISVASSASYSTVNPAQTPYGYNFYQNSSKTVSITGVFSANMISEAAYVLAVQHFFDVVQMPFYGSSANPGSPPPVLRLFGYGQYQFYNTPIVITNVSYDYPKDCDYIDVPNSYFNLALSGQSQASYGTANTDLISVAFGGGGATTRVPVEMNFTITALLQYSRQQISNQFNYSQYANGSLLGQGIR